ncbi:hypothetical protein DIS18_00025 [Algibacter marinivivus]|uniref:Uncharacterized protein n=1 Tax=Algibacter marinivivus TaxID=2100723 RepID=A0A2U2X5D0_9FLAO|nr:hypothetical protein [Algibacter marinivivus]PWH82983.1 hypothetical protein DIS18_00025 [Algibacter marinivivus]
MKNKFTNYFVRIFFITALLYVVSCETETLIEEEQVSDLNASISFEAKKGKKSNGATFDLSQECVISSQTDLYAGQNILVGNVAVEVNDGNYIITYNITDSGYCLTTTHLSVVQAPEDFPISGGGNPKNGHFEYSNSHDCVDSYSYEVPTSKGSYIAAHAVVNCVADSNEDDILSNLPETVSVCVNDKGVDAEDSYFNITIDPENSLTGMYDAWCIDVDLSLNDDQCFEADVYSSLNAMPGGLFENPDTFDSINWIMNQDFISQGYSFGDIQWAIWELIDDANCNACVYLGDDWSVAKGTEIYNLAVDNGDGFIPGCDELVAIALVDKNRQLQPIFISVPVTCNEPGDCEETAWGDGCDFPGNNWATYFKVSSGH